MMSIRAWIGTRAAGLAVCLVAGAGLASIFGCRAAGGAPAPLPLVCAFEDGLHASLGAANPFSASGGVTLVPAAGRTGKAARFAGHETADGGERAEAQKSALIFDGKSLPGARGTLAFQLRWSGQRHWADGKRTWLAVLAPRFSHADAAAGKEGTGLALLKEADNSLALAVYHFKGERLTDDFRGGGHDVAPPDAVPVRVAVANLKRDAWVSLRLAWDRAAGRVWLGVGDRVESAATPLPGTDFLCLLLGSPPSITSLCPQRGFDGDMDDLIVDARTPGEFPRAGLGLPANLPPMAVPEGGLEKARLLQDDPRGAKAEAALRTHLKRMLQAQKSGGWAYSVAFPSMMRFLSSSVAIPYNDEFVATSKEQNSAGGAIRILAAYEALGDEALLAAAEKTATVMQNLQQPEGHWVYGADVDPETLKPTWIRLPEWGPFEDHVQTAPILLMWRLHQLTGREEYARAAERGVAFILKGQNPNGSWAHKYDVKAGVGRSTSGLPDAGEINDHATVGQMRIMLLAYRRTGNPVYLASFLRGADWLVSAFIDKKAKGWAQQYDRNNVPIRARHFEPAAVSLSEGIRTVPETLVQAYWLTGDRGYLEPVNKWKAWMRANKVPTKEGQPGGWHAYYDVDTGQGIYSSAGQVHPANPRGAGDGGYTALMAKLDRMEEPAKPYAAGEITARAALGEIRGEVDARVADLDPVVGSWTYTRGPAGTCFSPPRPFFLPLAAAVFATRQIRGEIPWTHPLSSLSPADWGDVFYHVMPPAQLWKRLTAEETARARAAIPTR